jgi:hypothetical protein
VRLNSFEILPVFCQHIDVGLACLSSGIISTGITPSQAQKTVFLTLASDAGFLNLFVGLLVDGAVPLIALVFCENYGPRYHLL